MVTMFGMSSKVGPRALRTLRQSYMEEQGYATSSRQAGQELQKVVDDEINGILQVSRGNTCHMRQKTVGLSRASVPLPLREEDNDGKVRNMEGFEMTVPQIAGASP